MHFLSLLRPFLLASLLLCACGDRSAPDPAAEPAGEVTAPETPVTPLPGGAPAEEGADGQTLAQRELTAEEQKRVIDGVLQARARQQAEGLAGGSVKVNSAWPYVGYSAIAPDPAAAIEAHLVAVDVTISGHSEFFDLDDIEIVDGDTLVSFGSDPHAEPLRLDGSLLPADEAIAGAPAASRWLLIYAFPKAAAKFRLYYWGKELTPGATTFGDTGLSLPYPPSE